MKRNYEDRTRHYLPRRTYTVIRVDGRTFHTYTRNLAKPYDQRFVDDMTATATFLCESIQGARLAYVQSDEISVVLTDFDLIQTEAWFDGNVQKMASVSASLATARFNHLRRELSESFGRLATFDGRVFTVPDPVEVANYLIWRQRDAARNSIHMMARAHMSHRECHGKTGNELQELLWRNHNVNWNDADPRFKRGVLIQPVTEVTSVTYTHRDTGESQTLNGVERRTWVSNAAPRLAVDTPELCDLIPNLWLTSSLPPHDQLQKAVRQPRRVEGNDD